MSETIAYLDAKEKIDHRSRNPQVWERMLRELAKRSVYSPELHVRVLELGAGLGGLALELMDASRRVPLEYTLVDSDPEVVEEARRRIDASDRSPHAVYVTRADFFDSDFDERMKRADMIIAQSFLDLVDLREALPRIQALGKPGALLYAPVTFNGFTEFRPLYDNTQAEYALLKAYHRSMDERTGIHPDAGGSRAGWVLQRNLRRIGAELLETGSSDWLVSSDLAEGQNRDFLEQIVTFFEQSLTGRQDVDLGQLTRWLEVRRKQLRDGHLLVHIHNFDLLARFPG